VICTRIRPLRLLDLHAGRAGDALGIDLDDGPARSRSLHVDPTLGALALLAEFHRYFHMARRDQARLGIRPRPQEDEPTQHQARCRSTHSNRHVTIYAPPPKHSDGHREVVMLDCKT
jgi:hypothetical protein